MNYKHAEVYTLAVVCQCQAPLIPGSLNLCCPLRYHLETDAGFIIIVPGFSGTPLEQSLPVGRAGSEVVPPSGGTTLSSDTVWAEGVPRAKVMKKTTVLALLLVVLTYLMVGATVFQLLEQPYEQSQQASVSQARESFLLDNACVEPVRLDQLLEQTMVAVELGLDPFGNSSNVSTIWDIGSSFFFAGTVITTIGFGNISPKTEGGKIFCIVYALVGIPMFGFLLAGVGDQLGSALGQLIGKVEEIFLKWKVSPTLIRVLSTLLFILIGCLIFVCFPVLVFRWMEDWPLLDSVYFVVVALTTIGFGDYVAGGDSKRVYKVWYKPLVWFWILFGLAYFAAILSMIGDWLRVLSRRTRAEMGGLTTQAANWTANLTTEIKVTRQRLSLEIHDKARRGSVALVQKTSPEARGTPGSDPGPRGWEEAEAEEDDTRPFDFLGEDLAFIDADDSDRLSGRPSPVPAVRRAKHRGHRKLPRRANGFLGRQERPPQTRDTGENI